MQTKADFPTALLTGKQPAPLVEALFELNQLKLLYRQGWLRRGVPPVQCESVAEHTFAMAMLAMTLADAYFPQLDLLRVLRLVLLHDCGEIDAGDIVPADLVSAEEKLRRERDSVEKVFAHLPNGAAYLALWQEYEEGASAEARFVKQMDRLEMGVQACVYEQQGLLSTQSAQEFYQSVEAALTQPPLRELLDELKALKSKRT